MDELRLASLDQVLIKSYLLESADELGYRFIGSVPHLVPAKVAQIVIGWLCRMSSVPPPRTPYRSAYLARLTVIDHLVRGHSVFIVVEHGAQGIRNLGDDRLARRVELGQVIGLLDQQV